jgi:hypothetical protein
MADKTLSINLNNPGNLLYNANDKYASGTNGGYAVYLRAEQGIAALATLFIDAAQLGNNTSEKLCAYYLRITDINALQVALVSRYMADNTGIEPQQVPDLKDPLTLLCWVSNFISLLNDGSLFNVDSQLRGCALALNMTAEKFTYLVQPRKYAWQNGAGINGDKGFVNPTSDLLSSGASSLLQEKIQDLAQSPPRLPDDMNIKSYWNQKDMLEHLTTKQNNQSGTVAYSTAQLYDSNQGTSQLKRQQVNKQISLLDDQITSLTSEYVRTTDAYKKQVLNDQIQNTKFQRQGLVEQRMAINSQLTGTNKTSVINSQTGTEPYSQRDTDAALIQNNDIALRTQMTADAYMSQSGEIYQNNINQQALAQKNLGKTKTRKTPIGGGYVLPGTGSVTLGRSVFSKPVFRK